MVSGSNPLTGSTFTTAKIPVSSAETWSAHRPGDVTTRVQYRQLAATRHHSMLHADCTAGLRRWRTQTRVCGATRSPFQCQSRLDAAVTIETTCLQSTHTLSVTVAGLGFSRFPVHRCRPLSGLVVVKGSGQVPVGLLLTVGGRLARSALQSRCGARPEFPSSCS